MRQRRKQQGLTIVEFALVGLLTLTLLFATLEFSRLLYTWNALTDATRRGARLAAVCPLNDPAIISVTQWRRPDDSATGIGFPGLAADNIEVRYFDANGAVTANLQAVQFVQVAIEDYDLDLFIPGFNLSIRMPPFQTTLPSESLGLVPAGAGATDCTASG